VTFAPRLTGSDDQPITTILHARHFAASGSISEAGPGTIYISSAAQLRGLPVKKWNEEFVQEVIQAGKQDTEYQKALKEWEKEYGQEA